MRVIRSLPYAAAALWLAAAPLGPAAAAEPSQAADPPESFTLADPRIVESSGLQASLRHPGVYWTHNDSGYAPEIYAVDAATGETVATLTLDGVEFRDVEGIHLGPDGDLYVGDIGDNFDGAWERVWIYRFPEPAELADATLTPVVHTVRYDDGPRDAEALMVHPGTGRVYIASKKRDGSGALYAGPRDLATDADNVFERAYDTDLWVTGGAFSPDGTRLLLRGYFGAELFRWTEAEGPRSLGLVTVPVQYQGESVTFTPDGRAVMFGSEGEGSAVRPQELSGEQLPDSARRAGSGEEPADGAEPPGAEDAPAGEPAAGEEGGPASRLVLAAAAAAVLLLALRRAFRRDGRGGG